MGKVYVCNACGDEVTQCENCNKQTKDFDPKTLICAEGLSYIHFCSQECANEYQELIKHIFMWRKKMKQKKENQIYHNIDPEEYYHD